MSLAVDAPFVLKNTTIAVVPFMVPFNACIFSHLRICRKFLHISKNQFMVGFPNIYGLKYLALYGLLVSNFLERCSFNLLMHRFGYDYTGYDREMVGRPGYADERPHGRYAGRSSGGYGPPGKFLNVFAVFCGCFVVLI